MEELLNGSMEQAVEAIAHLAAGTRAGVFQKTAAPAWLTTLGEQVKDNPMLSHGLIGGGIGAVASGVNTAMNNRDETSPRKRSLLGSMLTGGVAGAGVGAGVGAARQGLAGIAKSGPGISGAAGMSPGQYTDPVTNKVMRIDPKALQDNPELHSRIKELTTPTAQAQVSGGFLGGLDEIRKQVPYTLPAVGLAATTDAILHNPLFGVARIRPGQAGGSIGTELLRYGKSSNPELESLLSVTKDIKPSYAADPGGLDSHAQLLDKRSPSTAWRRASEKVKSLWSRENPQSLEDILGSRRGEKDGLRPIAEVSHTPTKEITRTHIDKDRPQETITSTETTHGARKTKPIREGTVSEAKMHGHGNHPTYKGRQMYSLLGHTYAGAPNKAVAIGGRALAYGLPLGAEYLGRGLQENAANKKSLREIMEQYAKPVEDK